MLCVVGDLVEDVVIWLHGPIVSATDNPSDVHRTRGGSAANVAALAAGLVPTRFIGSVGLDACGAGLVSALTSLGVDVKVQRTGRTGTVVVLVETTGERTMFPDRGASAQLTDVPAEWIDNVDVLHIPAYAFAGGPTGQTVGEMARRVRAGGGQVTVDASAASLVSSLGADVFVDLVAELGAAVLFANADEAGVLGLGGERRLPAGCTAIIKHGPHPAAVLREGSDPVYVRAQHVDGVRDTTGAGDAFAAGFLAACLTGSEAELACVRGHEMAARVLTTRGAGGQAAASQPSPTVRSVEAGLAEGSST